MKVLAGAAPRCAGAAPVAARLGIWKVGSCDITWYIPYWLVYTTFVISVVISVQRGVIYHVI